MTSTQRRPPYRPPQPQWMHTPTHDTYTRIRNQRLPAVHKTSYALQAASDISQGSKMLGPLPVKPYEFPVPAERSVGGMFEALNLQMSRFEKPGSQPPHPHAHPRSQPSAASAQHHSSRHPMVSPPPDHIPTEPTFKERRAPFYWSRPLAVSIATWLRDPQVQARQIELESVSLRRAATNAPSPGVEVGNEFHGFRADECAKLKLTRLKLPIPAKGRPQPRQATEQVVDWLILEVRFHALSAGHGYPPTEVAEFDSETQSEGELPHGSREMTQKRRGEPRLSHDAEPFFLIALPTQAVTDTEVSAPNVRSQPSPSPSLAKRMPGLQSGEVSKQVWKILLSFGQRNRVPCLHTRGLDPGFVGGWMMAFAQGEALIEVGSREDIRNIFR